MTPQQQLHEALSGAPFLLQITGRCAIGFGDS
jgi:hypothetical protein